MCLRPKTSKNDHLKFTWSVGYLVFDPDENISDSRLLMKGHKLKVKNKKYIFWIVEIGMVCYFSFRTGEYFITILNVYQPLPISL